MSPRGSDGRATGIGLLFLGGFLQIGPGVPTLKRGLGVYRAAVDVDLEVEMAADGAGVSGLSDRADALASPDALAAVDRGGMDHVGVEIAAVLTLAVNQQVVAVEDRVVARAQHPPGRSGGQRRAAGSDDVEAFVRAAATARSAEFTDEATRPVRALDREDMGLELGRAIAAIRIGRPWEERGEQDEAEKERAPQWCSMTRSTMLYSFASAALMK